jgi:hypothetical protein
LSRTSGSANALATSAARNCKIGLGVPAGAISANQELNSKPGKPDSATVGTSGNCGMRRCVVTPIRRSLPPLISELTVAIPWNAV